MDSTSMPTTHGAAAPSYIYPIGYSNSSDCGYCRGGQSRKRFSYYASTTSLSPSFYQELVNRCWQTGRKSVHQAKKRDNAFDLVERISEPEFARLRTPPDPEHQFVVTLERDTFTEEKYAVYENYQRMVHQESLDKTSRAGFKRAVYFLYHEDIQHLNPGKLGALREIALAAEHGYRWWYSGYYIHSCPKMRYKIDYAPQYILDPETLAWDLLDAESLTLFEKGRYVSISMERASSSGTEKTCTAVDARPSAVYTHVQEVWTVEGQENSKQPSVNTNNQIDDDDEEGDEEDFLLTSNMPGIPSLQDMQQLGMGGLQLRAHRLDHHFRVSDLAVWTDDNVARYGTLEARVAELVAAVGPDLMGEMCLDFCHQKI
ncbi:hypothetical protein P8C59_005169 [Phyllachora maydis]|uniref:N-end rule aminoacyl transferase C-terminal domain-containing protein n=1 Tax=Phyllachora maydis TaxID=1825666 RepID=A0AAD9I4A7_9PEZI|nr:hypothetical protein P8C59_005169 [Phyllachora maydis]